MIKLLVNPFEKFSEKKLLIIGITFLIVGSYIGYFFNAYFDSLLHVSFVTNAHFFDVLLQNVSHSFVLTIFLFVLGKIINSKTRIIDTLNVVLISRIPFYFSVLINFNDYVNSVTNKLISQTDLNNISLTTNEYVVLLITSLVALLCLVWFGILIWNGFKTATNSKTIKAIILFIITLLFANFASSFLLQLLN